MKRFLFIGLALVIALTALRSMILFVDPTEYVYVTRFGAPVATYGGARDMGLRWKCPWPIESALRLDRRLDVLDVPTQEFLIRDRDEAAGSDRPLPLTFDLFVSWRIGGAREDEDAAAVDRFVRSFGNSERARAFLRTQVISRLKVELSSIAFAELVNTDAGKLRLHELLTRIRQQPYQTADPAASGQSLEQRAAQVGINLVDVGLRRFNHPSQVRGEIIAKIQEDRKREANNYRLEGEEIAAKIRAEGDLQAKRIRAAAEADRIRLEGQAEADATRILNEAQRQAPELYELVRLLESYPKMFDEKTQLILSLDHPLLKLFRGMPILYGDTGKEGAGRPAEPRRLEPPPGISEVEKQTLGKKQP
jgi:membrane protease subunit HflC